MENILSYIDPNEYNVGNKYSYNKLNVPRVTEILSAMLHEDYLMEWSNSIGLYQHMKYKDTLAKAANTGSHVHDAIDKYIASDKVFNDSDYSQDIRLAVSTAFNSFLEWWAIIQKTKYRVIMQEETLVCKYFGGTLDLLIEINGKVYIVDFKTSNHPSYKYFLQLSAYRYILEQELGVHIDGCIILLLNKKSCKFTEFILNFEDTLHLDFISKCQDTFMSLVYAYYNRSIVENMYHDIFGGKYGRNNRNA